MKDINQARKASSESAQGSAGDKRRSRGPRFNSGELMDVLEVSSDLICVCHDGVVSSVNSAGVRILGATDEEQLLGRKFTDFLAPEYFEAIDDFINVIAQETSSFPLKLIGPGGVEIGAEVTVHRARELGGDAVVILARDITDQNRLSEAIHRSEARYRKMVHNALDLICVCENGAVTFINEAGVAMLKAGDASQIAGKRLTELLHKDYRGVFADGIKQVVQEDVLLPLRLAAMDGTFIDAEIAITPFDGSIGALYMVEARDITHHNRAVEALYKSIQTLEERVKERTKELSDEVTVRKKAEETLLHMASHDGLTGLPNRALLMDRVTVALSRAKRYGTKAALLFVDLDDFKPVNDTLGHAAGDVLLKKVAKKLLSCERGSDTTARVGGDEFVLLLTDVTDESAVARVAEKILKTLSRPIPVGKGKPTIGASIGIAFYPVHGKTPEQLLKEADHAMYAAKRKGRNRFEFASSAPVKNKSAKKRA